MKFNRAIFPTAVLPLSIAASLSTSLLIGCGSSTSSDASTTSSSVLIVNEIVADAADGANDWIELYAKEDIDDLSVYSLIDDKDGREGQSLPAISLTAGEFIVIQAIDEDESQIEDEHYVTFKLGSDDAVTLLLNGDAVDQLDWQEGDAEEGASYGILNDIAQTLAPTPNAENELDDNSADTNDETASDDVVADAPSDEIIDNDAVMRINEIVASTSATDANDAGYDWIEFFITGATAVNLSDYTLTDSNLVLTQLPNVTLQPGDYYRVYASTDVTSVNDTATASVNLGASDTVNLYLGDDLIDSLSWKKGQALYGNSYGRFPDGSDNTKILTPTANAENVQSTNGPLIINEIVAVDENDGYDWFELYNNSDASINLSDYQVIDSSDDIDAQTLPDINLAAGDFVVIYATGEEISDHYVDFKLGKSDELSLLLNNDTVDYLDWDDSDVVVGYSFGRNPEDIYNFSTDTLTPTPGQTNVKASAFDSTTVNNLYFEISTENWQSILANPLDEEYHETSITFNGITLDSVAIRTKGGSSLNSVARSTSDRYSFKIDINEYVSGQKLLGLKKFTLQNSFNDPSYMREVIAYQLLDEMGVATPNNAYVNVYINNELFGFYLMVEAIDGEFLEDNFENSNGDLYKPDGTGSDLNWINSSIASYSDINLQTNEDTTDGGAFINFVDQMAQGSTQVIDEDSVLRYMAVSTSLSNLDSYHGALAHNYYIYEQDNVFSLLPWDFNEAFGSFSMGCNGVDVRELYIDEPTDGALSDKPLIANVFADDDNLAIYHGYISDLIDNQLSASEFSSRVNNIADLIREHVQNDPSGFYTASDFENNLTSTVDRFYGLTEFMTYRVNNMSQQLAGTAASSSSDGSGFCGSSSNSFSFGR